MSQKTRATCASSWCQGSSWKVLGSGRARTSASWTRLNPSMAEPSKVIPSSSAFSSSAEVMLNPLGVPEHVGEPQLDEADAPLLDGPQHVVPLALHRTSFACAANRPRKPTARAGPARSPTESRRWRRYPGMMPHLRLAAAQLNTVVGDLAGNVERMLAPLAAAEAAGADICVVPELAIPGYPPEDLLLKPGFVADNVTALEKVAAATGHCAVVVGFVGAVAGRLGLANAAAVCAGGRVAGVYRKHFLPELRRVRRAALVRARATEAPPLFGVAGAWVGVSICEDVWFDDGPVAAGGAGRRRRRGEPQRVALQPGPAGRAPGHAAGRVAEAGCAIAYVNQVGGQDELVFDGDSLIVGADGTLLAIGRPVRRGPGGGRPADRVAPTARRDRAAAADRGDRAPAERAGRAGAGRDRAAPSERPRRGVRGPGARHPRLPGQERVQRSGDRAVGRDRLVAGRHDRGRRARARRGCTASPCRRATRARARVEMPRRWPSGSGSTSRWSPIEEAHVAFASMLAPRARTRAVRAHRREPAVAPPRRAADGGLQRQGLDRAHHGEQERDGHGLLHALRRLGGRIRRDQGRAQDPGLRAVPLPQHASGARGLPGPIPDSVLDKPPSAELRPDQRDDQSLPPYEELDPVLQGYVEGDRTAADLVAEGFDPAVVDQVVRLVDGAEYKRRQMPPGVRITTKAFGKDRRMPITNRYRSSALEESGGAVRPAVDEHADWRTIDELAALVGAYCWVEHRIFELTRGLGDRAGTGRTGDVDPRCGCGRRRCRGATAPWPAAGPSASRAGGCRSGRPGRRPRTGRWPARSRRRGRLRRHAGLGVGVAAGRDGSPLGGGVYGSHLAVGNPGERGHRSWRSWWRPTGMGRRDPGRPLPPGAASKVTGTPSGRRNQTGVRPRKAFSLLYRHLDSTFTLTEQPTCARNGRRLRCTSAPGEFPCRGLATGRFGDDLGQGTN